MYPVSEAFLKAVQGNTRKYYWTGKIDLQPERSIRLRRKISSKAAAISQPSAAVIRKIAG